MSGWDPKGLSKKWPLNGQLKEKELETPALLGEAAEGHREIGGEAVGEIRCRAGIIASRTQLAIWILS